MGCKRKSPSLTHDVNNGLDLVFGKAGIFPRFTGKDKE
jgi:hypothetical protein